MTDRNDDQPSTQDMSGSRATRRALLKLGAVAVPAAVTVKPAFAAAAASAMMCTIPIPNNIDSTGTVQPGPGPNTYAPPPHGSYTGEEVRTQQPNQFVTPQQFDAHLQYIRRLSRGTPGYTCFASVASAPPV